MDSHWFSLLVLSLVVAVLFVIGLWFKEPKPPQVVTKIERSCGPDGEPGVPPTKKQKW